LQFTPVEFGSANLFPSDPLFQQINGLFGAVIIEPKRSTWQCGEPGSLASCEPSPAPATTRASATVTTPRFMFREFAVMMSDNLRISINPGGQNVDGNSSAINYRTEPWKYRYPPANPTQDLSCMTSSQLISNKNPPGNPDPQTPMFNQDPQTPIFRADIGDQARFRLLHPFGTGTSQVFVLHGHPWQRNPYQNKSTIIANNNLSQWLGSRDNYGSTDHADVVIERAGGRFGRGGDYLYTAFAPNQAMLGVWGLFRVGPVQASPAVINGACAMPAAPALRTTRDPNADLKRFVRQPINTVKRP
jgi:manganese oxidase